MYLTWRCNELLMATQYGLLRWVSLAHKDYRQNETRFRPIKDNDLWEWGF